jgi:hypothetical protein
MNSSTLLRRIENGRTDLLCALIAAADGADVRRDHGAHRIHPDYKPMRASVLGQPQR